MIEIFFAVINLIEVNNRTEKNIVNDFATPVKILDKFDLIIKLI